jgi:DNA-binding transcriptional MerR regulator
VQSPKSLVLLPQAPVPRLSFPVKHSSPLEGSRKKREHNAFEGCYFRIVGEDVPVTAQYRIGEFADLSGVSAQTLRFYDEIGLLRPASVDPRTRYRRYLPEQLQKLASILALKELGVPLAKVRNLTRKAGSEKERRQLLFDLKRTIEQSITTATQSLSWIDAALKELDEREQPIPVVVKRRLAFDAASIRSRVRSYADIERLERELFAELPAQAIGDPRGVLWHRCADSDYLEGEAFVGLKERVRTRTVYEVRRIPAATLACAYSASDDQSAEHAYAAIRKWMKLRGYRLAGPKREIYLPDLLEIQFPLQSG